QVTSVIAPTHAVRGQSIQVTYTVTNLGSATAADESSWIDEIFLSRDRYLDVNADRYLTFIAHGTGLAAGGSYTITQNVTLPSDLLGPYYVIVITDPPGRFPIGQVFEGDNENNNDTPSDVPVVIDQPPASDLVVTLVSAPAQAKPGEPITVS